jgi:hypothetical protein
MWRSQTPIIQDDDGEIHHNIRHSLQMHAESSRRLDRFTLTLHGCMGRHIGDIPFLVWIPNGVTREQHGDL